jgi:phosphoribosyl 1,2-cyclic phosphodiesterase
MIRNGLSIQKVRAIFITHEHTDHTRGAEVLSRKYRIPVYITTRTFSNSRLNIAPPLLKDFSAYSPVHLGGLTVNPFPKFHDASDPHSFTVSSNGTTVGVMTDMGTACDHVIRNLSQCNAAFLEANYDEEMLENGRYPVFLKKRIRSMEGHLSNNQALDLFRTYKSTNLRLLILSHLSAHNNKPEIVQELFSRHANGTQIVVASRYEETEVFRIQ